MRAQKIPFAVVVSLITTLGACAAEPADDGPDVESSEDEITLSTCSGTPKLPATGNLAFTSGSKKTYSRECNAFGKCAAWKVEKEEPLTARKLPPGIGDDAFLTSDGDVLVSGVRVGETWLSQAGSSQYLCKNMERGRGNVDRATGTGTAELTAEMECDIAGGSGGPHSAGPRRAARLRLGSRCLAITDAAPKAAPGTQRRSVLRLAW